MLKAERHQKILLEISRNHIAHIGEISKMLKMSSYTIRRDIEELSNQGLLKAVRGGAVSAQHHYPNFNDRQNLHVEYKKVIAKKTLNLITPGQVIMVDAGTTTRAAMENLSREIKLTVITNNFPVADILQHYPNISLFFLGGQVNKNSFSTFGNETVQAIQNFTADLCLLGICSIDLKFGVTGADYQESLIKKAMIERSRYVAALSTSDKMGHADTYRVCDLGKLDMIVTERDPSTPDFLPYGKIGVEIK